MPTFRATFLPRLAVIVIVLALAWTRVSESATLTLAWDQSTDPNVAGYVLYWGTHSGVYGSQSNVGNQRLVQVGGLADGTNYYFVVSAYNAAGQLSLPSAEVSGQTPVTATNAPSVSCTAPTASSLDGNPVIVKFRPSRGGRPATCYDHLLSRVGIALSGRFDIAHVQCRRRLAAIGLVQLGCRCFSAAISGGHDGQPVDFGDAYDCRPWWGRDGFLERHASVGRYGLVRTLSERRF